MPGAGYPRPRVSGAAARDWPVPTSNIERDWPVPTSKNELSRFIGLLNYYRRFVDGSGYADIGAPLTRPCGPHAPWAWKPTEERSFEILKTPGVQCYGAGVAHLLFSPGFVFSQGMSVHRRYRQSSRTGRNRLSAESMAGRKHIVGFRLLDTFHTGICIEDIETFTAKYFADWISTCGIMRIADNKTLLRNNPQQCKGYVVD